MATCKAPHPEDAERRCQRAEGTHADHSDREGIWPNEKVREALRIKRAHGTNRRGRKKSPHQELVGIAASGARGIREFNGGGVPVEAEQAWSKQAWLPYATETFRTFLREHPGREFTTAEDVWPLLETPEEMRAMVVVVRTMLREHGMVEVGAKRLKGTYRTKDGVEFAENKLVPIYRAAGA